MLQLSKSARHWLLEVARSAVVAAGRGETCPMPSIPSAFSPEDRSELERVHAAFVSIHKRGRLRGCVGQVGSDTPLVRLVPEVARAAACQDARFSPVSAGEVADLEIEISILSAFFRIRPEDVIPGTHGLLIRQGIYRGLLLPQVAKEGGWDATRFLREACRKAGLDPEAWKHGASIEGFTADIISEPCLTEISSAVCAPPGGTV